MNSFFQETNEINLEGFQVVSRDMFVPAANKFNEPHVTLWYDSMTFNKAAVSAMNFCERILIQVNPQSHILLISPVSYNDKDSICWISKNHKDQAKKFFCSAFTTKLYELFSWNKGFVYKALGRTVISNGKVMLMFDLSNPMTWSAKKETNDEQ